MEKENQFANGVRRVVTAAESFLANETSLSQAARLAELSLEEFIEYLGGQGINAVSYPAAELDEEIVSLTRGA